MPIARREILGLALGAGFLARLNAMPAAFHRCYRAHATITLLSVPVVSKADVGSGYILIEEGCAPLNKTAIQFGAGSWPESAHGLNRLGFIREEVTEKSSGEPAECAYFAFMTTSQEKNLDQARRTMEGSEETIPYAAAEGLGRNGRFVSRLSHIDVSSRLTWRDCAQLIEMVRDSVANEAAPQRFAKMLRPNESAPATFLYAVRKAILDPAPSTTGSLVYNGKDFVLRTVKEPDNAACAHFAEKNILSGGARVMRLDAKLRERIHGQETTFRVWFEAGAEHLPPLRFEYQAKSFLRLTFEFDPGAAGTPAGMTLDDLALKTKERL